MITSLASPRATICIQFLNLIGLLALVLGLSSFTQARAAGEGRERTSFNAGWRFQKGDPAEVQDALTYLKVKPWLLPMGSDLVHYSATPVVRPEGELGDTVSYAKVDYDDGAWRKLDLPHDWGSEGPFNYDLPGETGKLPWPGTGWYRKQFSVPASDVGKRVYLDVDGAMAYSLVWLNGHFVGGWPYGYSSYRLDLTPFLKVGGANVIAVRLNNLPDSSRWYPGSGIYRNVWLVKTAPLHFSHWGVFVSTPKITADSAWVDVQVTAENATSNNETVQVSTRVYALGQDGAPTGQPVAEMGGVALKLSHEKQAMTSLGLQVPKPRLWSLRAPQRYVAVTTLEQNGQVVDTEQTPFGIRTIEFTPDRGFLLNGERVQINGVCNHHDLGALGAAVSTRALERQIDLLQEMGCNAIRTSHNPPAPELLDLCDRKGMLVMDEAFDCWAAGKKPNDYHLIFPEWHEKDLRALVRRDRNHPSVVLWSIGNEIVEQGLPEGWKLARHLTAIVAEEDHSRPVGGGFNSTESGYNGFHKAVDVVGYNYKPYEYGKFHTRNPYIPLIGSETSSCISTRGEYFFPVTDDKSQGKSNFQMSSYDLYAPRWATTPDMEFAGQESNPFVAGEFVWTGFDYLGEPTPYNSDSTNLLNFADPAQRARAEQELKELGKIRVPSRSSYFGIIDLAGFKKDRFYLYQAHWRPDLPMAHILPHWTWSDRQGEVTPVHVYTSGDEAELFLNGQSLGRKKKEALHYRLRWDDVKYTPGELRVVAYKNGTKWAEETIRTAGAAAKLVAEADRSALAADGRDLAFVSIAVVDDQGTLVPRSSPTLHFSVAGPADIVAVDNGDPTSFESFQANERKAFNGRALVVLRTRPGTTGEITLAVEADHLPKSVSTLHAVDSR